MVMPCSRSARRPSVSNARLTSSSPRRSESRSTAASWSSRIDLVSYSRRPISVLLPSSTEPAVATRTMPAVAMSGGTLEVALPLAVLHGRLGEAVVGPGGAPFGDAGGGHLLDDLGHARRRRAHRAGAAHVADGAVADDGVLLDDLAGLGGDGTAHG